MICIILAWSGTTFACAMCVCLCISLRRSETICCRLMLFHTAPMHIYSYRRYVAHKIISVYIYLVRHFTICIAIEMEMEIAFYKIAIVRQFPMHSKASTYDMFVVTSILVRLKFNKRYILL